jgi:hypothetical protein
MRRRVTRAGLVLTALAALVAGAAAPAAGDPESYPSKFGSGQGPVLSGAAEFRDVDYGTNITECPQARLDKYGPLPLERRVRDSVEQYSDGGDDRRTNEEYFCFPQNETSIDVNPLFPKNLVAGANDYRMGWGTSGFYASTDNGQKWYTGVLPFPSWGGDDHVDGGGDPAIVYDRAGVVYYVHLQFERENDTNGLFLNRSTNGGFTWSRPCVPIGGGGGQPPPTEGAVCGGPGDPRQPGDGVVSFFPDNDKDLNGSVPFEDKEYIGAGPRPAGVEPVCFTPITRTPMPCPEGTVGVDRIYVTWTRFDETPPTLFGFTAKIYISFSDDQGRSWSRPRAISGSAPFCAFFAVPTERCDLNQFSNPTVHPETGLLGVAFQNFNTPDENQYLFVRSRDGGMTFEGPFFVTPVFDVNFPRAGAAGGRPDCTARGQQGGRIVYTNSCFRSNSGGNVVVDKRGGAFADDFYLVISDNRNGTRVSSNADVFLFRSTDGGSTWVGPTRVNNDRSDLGAVSRDCPPTEPGCLGNFGNDQWWPWVDINDKGHLNVAFKDRRLDVDSATQEWPLSRQRPGNYLVWTWGAQCEIGTTAEVTGTTTTIPEAARQCLAPAAAVIPQPTEVIDPGADPVPGQGAAFLGPYHNFGISDFPSNYDYCFRAGIFCGDYDVVVTDDADTKVYAHFTDARNGRSSRQQAGRNPACEQSDVMVDQYSSTSADAGQKRPKREDSLFLVTPCPADSGEWRVP